jgi:hypothetical protein
VTVTLRRVLKHMSEMVKWITAAIAGPEEIEELEVEHQVIASSMCGLTFVRHREASFLVHAAGCGASPQRDIDT